MSQLATAAPETDRKDYKNLLVELHRRRDPEGKSTRPLDILLRQSMEKDADLRGDIARAEKKVHPNPTPAQQAAGNYRKGHIYIQGLDIAIESAKGSWRRGVNAEKKPWKVKMKHNYGYIRRYVSDADGDNVDVFIGDDPDSQLVVCADQYIDGKFDEHKFLVGTKSIEDARKVYWGSYSKGFKGKAEFTSLTMPQFKSWLEKGRSDIPLKKQRFSQFHKRADASYNDRFHRPENWDPTSKLKGVPEGMLLYVGANDWESCGWTWAALFDADTHESPSKENHYKEPEPVAWLHIDHSKCPVCKGDGEYYPHEDNRAEAKEWAAAQVRAWLKEVELPEKKSTALPLLRRAKEHSDNEEYRQKAEIMHSLMVTRPDEFIVDSDDGGHAVGITHVPTKFRMHIPRKEVPPVLLEKVAGLRRCPKCNGLCSVRKAKAGHTMCMKCDHEFAVETLPDNEWMEEGNNKSADEQPASPVTVSGLQEMAARLGAIDLDKLEEEQKRILKTGAVSKRAKAVKLLGIISGLRRNNVSPSDLMIKSVPVLPAIYRPFAVAGDTFIPGAANELYRDLITVRNQHRKIRDTLGGEHEAAARGSLYNAVKAVMGFGESENPKTRARNVSGFFDKIIGPTGKHSFLQRRLLSKPQDMVSRGTIQVNPDLNIDEIGLSESQAWTSYAPFTQRRLVRMGYTPAKAIVAIRDQDPMARRALEEEMKIRPVVYSRAPAWHKQNVISGWARLVPGHGIHVNPYVTAGLGADFDGDAINVHVPAGDDALEEAKSVLLPSRMPFAAKKPDDLVPAPKHEQVLPLFAATQRPAGKVVQFKTKDEALAAIRGGSVALQDEVEFDQQN